MIHEGYLTSEEFRNRAVEIVNTFCDKLCEVSDQNLISTSFKQQNNLSSNRLQTKP